MKNAWHNTRTFYRSKVNNVIVKAQKKTAFKIRTDSKIINKYQITCERASETSIRLNQHRYTHKQLKYISTKTLT